MERPASDRGQLVKHDEDAVTNVAWSAVDKRKLVELVDQLTTNVGGLPGHLDTGKTTHCPASVADNEDKVPGGDLTEIGHESTSGKDRSTKYIFKREPEPETAQIQDQQLPEFVPEENAPCCGPNGIHEEVMDLSPASSVSPDVPKSHVLAASPDRESTSTARTDRPSARLAENPVKRSAKVKNGSSEVWTSVDKTLVEELFDRLLRSFDDFKVGRPETDVVGSRGPLSANQRRPSGVVPPDDVITNDPVDGGGLWSSVAYKWKSHILLRMRCGQQAAKPETASAPQCRKRRYDDRKRKLIQIN